jgi:hypothetical protein
MQTFRIDKAEFKMQVTPEGYLQGEAVVTRTGVFRYIEADGTERLELRHKDDVLRKESLDTLKLIPVTLFHPPEMVNAENARLYSVGSTGESYSIEKSGDVDLISSRFSVNDAKAVDEVKTGRARQLSLGYMQESIPEEGVYNGQRYTHRQTNIKYNHLALVPKGRAGDVACIRMDGAAWQIDSLEGTTEESLPMPNESPRTDALSIKNISYQVPPEVRVAYDEASAELTTLKASLDAANAAAEKAEADKSALQAKFDMLKEEKDKLEKDSNDKEGMKKAVKDHLDLIAKASKLVKLDNAVDMDSKDIMVAAIKAFKPNFDEAGKDDAYIKAAFETVTTDNADGGVTASGRVPVSVSGQRAPLKFNADMMAFVAAQNAQAASPPIVTMEQFYNR